MGLTLAVRLEGDGVWERVGREPSGTAFNSLVQLEVEHGIPRNPFINAGALVVLDMVLSHQAHGSRQPPGLRASARRATRSPGRWRSSC